MFKSMDMHKNNFWAKGTYYRYYINQYFFFNKYHFNSFPLNFYYPIEIKNINIYMIQLFSQILIYRPDCARPRSPGRYHGAIRVDKSQTALNSFQNNGLMIYSPTWIFVIGHICTQHSVSVCLLIYTNKQFAYTNEYIL